MGGRDVMNVLLDDGNEIGKYKGVKRCVENIVEFFVICNVHTHTLKHKHVTTHTLAHSLTHSLTLSLSLSRADTICNKYYEMMRYVPSSNTDGTR
jgi:hypothetical protein